YTGSGGYAVEGSRSVGVYGQEVLGATGLTTETGSEAENTGGKDGEQQLAERRVVFMGLPRSGKTSILRVIFENDVPYDTMSLMPTQQRTEHRLQTTGISFYDFPGIDDFLETQYADQDPAIYAGEYTSLVYVMDSQSDIQSALTTFLSVVRAAQSVNVDIPINFFINKVDGLSPELRQDIQHDIQQRIFKNMGYENLNTTNVYVFQTTIFDLSIREALSRVIQNLVPNSHSLETILNSFLSKSSLDKVFLFDIASKMYLARDSTPTDAMQYVFACETIDAVDNLTLLGVPYLPATETEITMQRINVTFDANDEMFIYQVSPELLLLCIGSPRIIRQASLLEFNSSKVAKAIRQILRPRSD
ncbi:hypothetical protein GGF46_003443, partial [Coemansia sp. RSA 552]